MPLIIEESIFSKNFPSNQNSNIDKTYVKKSNLNKINLVYDGDSTTELEKHTSSTLNTIEESSIIKNDTKNILESGTGTTNDDKQDYLQSIYKHNNHELKKTSNSDKDFIIQNEEQNIQNKQNSKQAQNQHKETLSWFLKLVLEIKIYLFPLGIILLFLISYFFDFFVYLNPNFCSYHQRYYLSYNII